MDSRRTLKETTPKELRAVREDTGKERKTGRVCSKLSPPSCLVKKGSPSVESSWRVLEGNKRVEETAVLTRERRGVDACTRRRARDESSDRTEAGTLSDLSLS